MGELWFVTGGARSGKSRFAERLAGALDRPVVYIATMEPLDDELVARVKRHRMERPQHWTTVEVPRDLVPAIRAVAAEHCVLVDCLSLWVSNWLLAAGEGSSAGHLIAVQAALDAEIAALLETVAARAAPTILVSNEVGGGVVPEYALGRTYRDLLGHVNQLVAAPAARAWLLVAGRALSLPASER